LTRPLKDKIYLSTCVYIYTRIRACKRLIHDNVALFDKITVETNSLNNVYGLGWYS